MWHVWETRELHTGFWLYLRERDRLEYLSVDGRILICIFMKWDEGTEWIDLAQDKDRCWPVNMVMNLRLHEMRGISGLAADLLASQK